MQIENNSWRVGKYSRRIPSGFLAYKLKVFSDNPVVLLKIQASLYNSPPGFFLKIQAYFLHKIRAYFFLLNVLRRTTVSLVYYNSMYLAYDSDELKMTIMKMVTI